MKLRTNDSEKLSNLWKRIRPVLEESASRVLASEPNLQHLIDCSSNESFLLRIFSAFSKSDSGDEIAVAIDITSTEAMLCFKTVIAFDSGQILIIGPSKNVPSEQSIFDTDAAFSEWLFALNEFLKGAEPKIIAAIAQLS